MRRELRILAWVGAITIAIGGCALQSDSPQPARNGYLAGALDEDRIERYMNEQQVELERAMHREREAGQLEIERLRGDALKLTVGAEAAFDFAKSQIKPTFRPSLDKLAPLVVKYNQTVVHVIGHTDSIGSDGYNQSLSARRAQSVGDYLGSYGVPRERLRTKGRGEREPRAENTTAAGRQLNRRVEIFIVPIVKGRDTQAYELPAYD